MSAKGTPKPRETVWLTHSSGTRVRVAADDAAKYISLGYVADKKTKKAKKTDKGDE